MCRFGNICQLKWPRGVKRGSKAAHRELEPYVALGCIRKVDAARPRLLTEPLLA